MEKGMSILIIAFVAILLGAVFLGILADDNYANRTLDVVSNDTFTSSNTTCTQITNGCIDSVTAVYNASAGGVLVGSANYTLCRSSTGRQDGILINSDAQITGTAISGKSLNATYKESRNCMYIVDNTTKSLLNVIPILFAIGIIAVGVWLFVKSKEDWS